MWDLISGSELAALGSVIMIDVVLSGDNAIVIGMAAAGLPPKLRRRAIVIGIGAATALRIAFATITYHLLAIIGLTLAGGLLLLWVCWKLWREIRGGQLQAPSAEGAGAARAAAANPPHGQPRKTLRQALVAIVVADVSMSLDNVLAVAGASRDHLWVLVFGLVLSITLMGVASNYVAKLLERHHWIAYVGLVIVAYVALDMIYHGALRVGNAI